MVSEKVKCRLASARIITLFALFRREIPKILPCTYSWAAKRYCIRSSVGGQKVCVAKLNVKGDSDLLTIALLTGTVKCMLRWAGSYFE